MAADPRRHILLVTATPHSGKEEPFRSLLTFLDDDFDNLPEDLSGETNQRWRKRLAQHFIQRRRADIRHYLDADTPFPERLEGESTYKLFPEYKRPFDRVLEYARESVQDVSGGQFHQRVRWWSALALLRSLASSPAAAAATLRSRAKVADTETWEDTEELGRLAVMDLSDNEPEVLMHAVPGADLGVVDVDTRHTLTT